jgi:light-regulated signal transduction histidine kinase (bacteriophytochrome)
VTLVGPPDLVDLAADVDAMRGRVVDEVRSVEQARAELESTIVELERSNVELEQFAYVASHDLQEPLRKVVSFCQLLERRYKGQLDERADEYIAFAVDGASRMQVLINDLLAFSRVGRTTGSFEEVDLEKAYGQALRNLQSAIEDADADVSATPLPTVAGDPSLLTALIQNLVGNAVKFHGDAAPVVRIEAHRVGDEWTFAITDNGIGIEPRFVERVFLIFQRLHGRDLYAGTGIGLALCKKIVEFHGGRIWIDTEYASGTRICWTLPASGQV